MYNVFKEPITFELNASGRLAACILLFGLIPAMACLSLYQRLPLLVIALTAGVLAWSVHLIKKYALRHGSSGIRRLRLHNDKALITYTNADTELVSITQICVAGEWVVLELGGASKKIIIDKTSVGARVFSNLIRQINAYRSV